MTSSRRWGVARKRAKPPARKRYASWNGTDKRRRRRIAPPSGASLRRSPASPGGSRRRPAA